MRALVCVVLATISTMADGFTASPTVTLRARRDAVAAGATVLMATLEPNPDVVAAPPRAVGSGFVERFRAAAGKDTTRVTIDRDFTVATLVGADFADVGCLHMVAHGAWDDDREIGSVLALHPDSTHSDGVLGAEHLERLTIVPPLVFLSACRAGDAYPRRGDGYYNTLAGPLLRGGARAVIQSRADLDYLAHQQLILAFHRALAAGAAPAEALRRARAALTEGGRDVRRLAESRVQLVGCGVRRRT